MVSHMAGAHLGAAFIILEQNDIEHGGPLSVSGDFEDCRDAVTAAVLSI
jgi:hypothetical protein